MDPEFWFSSETWAFDMGVLEVQSLRVSFGDGVLAGGLLRLSEEHQVCRLRPFFMKQREFSHRDHTLIT